tara:strand:- start:161 stop:1615 length:1455 start_codon:yes stop_codon:yes gene_type:complete
MSEIKVNKITPRTACGTTQLGDSGDTFTVPSGATVTVASGATISNLGTATGFGGTGVVSWDTSSIKTTGFTAVTGTGYFCNTTGGGFTVTLPLSPSAGDVVGVSDYAQTWDTDNLTLGRNGSNISGVAASSTISTAGLALTLVYVDVTKGWIVTDSGNQSEAPLPQFVTATGGCITTCGDYKIHTFFSPGSLCVSCAGNANGSNTVDYLVVGGGGGGYNASPGPSPSTRRSGGGGAGGYRESPGSASGCYTVSPRGAAPAVALPVSSPPYPIVVGAGGGACSVGDASSFDSITSAGGGKAGGYGNPTGTAGGSGGSGGGGGASEGGTAPGGSGNTPPVSPAQGTDGGNGVHPGANTAGGGGGAISCGTPGKPNSCSPPGGNGGEGAGTAINLTTMPAPSPTPSSQIGTPGPSPSVRYLAGGGGGSHEGAVVPGGAGGGGDGGYNPSGAATNGTINTGGGAGGNLVTPAASSGGSGIVIIRYKYQ